MIGKQGVRTCWCGHVDGLFFSPEYGACRACGTLISQCGLTSEQLLVQNDETDFYGKHYWLGHQHRDLGFPDIHIRARQDLAERNLHWLKTLLKYRLPPSKVLEVGCAHGSFVALLRQAGYDACGVEMSPWVVEFGRDTFGAPIAIGPVETLAIAHGSLDVIVLMDVLEHLPDPVATMAHCLNLLQPDGLLLVQTPQFKEGMDYRVLVETKDAFLEQLKSDEHLYLFSERSISHLLHRLGVECIQFEPAIFDRYDMFFVASRVSLQTHTPIQMASALLATPAGRFDLALLDLWERAQTLVHTHEAAEVDRTARGEQIHTLTQMLRESEADRAARGEQIHTLTQMLHESEADRMARGEQIQTLTQMLHEAEMDRTARNRDLKVNQLLKTVAVDITPMLPGGENGGAKIFVRELLRHLAETAPQTQFVLLTQAATHEELASLDRPNMRRLMVLGPRVTHALRPRLMAFAARVLPHVPVRLRGMVSRVGYRLNAILKRGGSATLLRDMGVDLLFCPFTAPTYFEPGIPTVCTIYDLQYKNYPEFFAVEDLAHRDRTFVEACRKAAILVAISDYSRDSAIVHGHLDPASIRTIHLRLSQRIIPNGTQDDSVLYRLGLIRQRYLIYPANFWQHKNHEMLLTAFGMACHQGMAADVKLVCTGAPGARQQWLQRTVRSMMLGDRVLFPGYLPDGDLAILMAQGAGMIFPSLYEGFGLPVMEAMAAGVPVACSNATALPEIAADAAILFDPRIPAQIARAMVSLVEDQDLRSHLIQAGQRRAVEFSDSQRMAREYWELFQLALTIEKRETLLMGAYSDGWAGPRLTIQIAPATHAHTVEMALVAPKWLPRAPLTIQAHRDGRSQGSPLVLSRGARAIFSLPVETGRCYEVTLSPTFIPAHSGQGEDQRVLSVMLERCHVVCTDGGYIELLPQ